MRARSAGLASLLAVAAVSCAREVPPSLAEAATRVERGPVAVAEIAIDLGRTPLLGATHGVLLVGYDVEAVGPDETDAFLKRVEAIHRELAAPATFFPTGAVLEIHAQRFGVLGKDPLFDVESHTYTHERLKDVWQRGPDGLRFFAAARRAELERSLERSAAAFQAVLGRAPRGLTAPYGAYRGLGDRSDLLDLVSASGIRFVRSYSRNADDWQPVPFEVQPFWYALQGFPDLLEIPIQGWQDVLWRETHGWQDLAGFRAVLDAGIDTIARRNLVWSYCAHDWSSLKEDPELSLVRHLLARARERGVVVATHAAFYDAALAARDGG